MQLTASPKLALCHAPRLIPKYDGWLITLSMKAPGNGIMFC